MPTKGSLSGFIDALDRSQWDQKLAVAEAERVAFVSRHPFESLPDMTVQDYAQGQPGGKDSFVNMLQGGTSNVAAVKHMRFEERSTKQRRRKRPPS
jgi:hypothetical protein